MSFSLDAVRRYGPPLEQRVNELGKLIAKNAADNNPIETDDIVGLGDSDHSLVKYYDELNGAAKFDTSIIGTTGPKVVFEPDYSKLTAWLRFSNLGWELTDYAGLGNVAEIFGEPCLDEGVDLGFFGGPSRSVAHAADSTGTISYKIPDSPMIQIAGNVVGHSFFIRFNLTSLAQNGGRDATLYEKYDNEDNFVSIRVDPNGAVKYFVRKIGVDYFKKTANSVITVNTDIDLIVLNSATTNSQLCYVNAVAKTLTTFVEVAGLDDEIVDGIIWANNSQTAGFVNGKPMDFRHFKELKLTQTHATNLFTNKISISSAAFGEVAVVDGCIMPRYPIGDSFTSTSFDVDSFT
jgi:hypothetical protein